MHYCSKLSEQVEDLMTDVESYPGWMRLALAVGRVITCTTSARSEKYPMTRYVSIIARVSVTMTLYFAFGSLLLKV
jgi:hypothetical protein